MAGSELAVGVKPVRMSMVNGPRSHGANAGVEHRTADHINFLFFVLLLVATIGDATVIRALGIVGQACCTRRARHWCEP